MNAIEVYHRHDVLIPEGYCAEEFRPPKKKKSPVKIVRVVRVLEYVGPEKWIKDTMKRNYVRGFCSVGSDRTIRELSTFKEELK